MGGYRKSAGAAEDKISELRLCRDKRRVDSTTYYAAKKVFMTADQDEAMKYAFIFAILRGYNVRSVIGACFAQEMSLRWIFAAKGWPQFRKKPGVYLDIEACLLGDDGKESVNDFLLRQIADYKNANNPEAEIAGDALFDRPEIVTKTVESPSGVRLQEDYFLKPSATK
jgi:hypothetical protein